MATRAGVPQKGKNQRKRAWNYNSIHGILAREEYYTGKLRVKWDGTEYQTAVPTIIDQVTWQAVKDRQARYIAYPSGNYKHYALAAGPVYCHACGVRMSVHRRKQQGNGKTYS